MYLNLLHRPSTRVSNTSRNVSAGNRTSRQFSVFIYHRLPVSPLFGERSLPWNFALVLCRPIKTGFLLTFCVFGSSTAEHFWKFCPSTLTTDSPVRKRAHILPLLWRRLKKCCNRLTIDLPGSWCSGMKQVVRLFHYLTVSRTKPVRTCCAAIGWYTSRGWLRGLKPAVIGHWVHCQFVSLTVLPRYCLLLLSVQILLKWLWCSLKK